MHVSRHYGGLLGCTRGCRARVLQAPWMHCGIAWESTSTSTDDASGAPGDGEVEHKEPEGKAGYFTVEEHEKAWAKKQNKWEVAEAFVNLDSASISDASKQRMHTENPQVSTVDKLAAEYRIRKQRVHAILWLKELEKEEEARLGHPLDDSIEKVYENFYGTVPKAERGKHMPDIEVGPEGWEGKSEDHSLKQQSEKEEQILVEEFERRMDFNKKQLYGFVKNHIMSRRRPIDGWSYMVEELGMESRRGKSGGVRNVTEPDGLRRGVNHTQNVRRRDV